MLQVEVIDNKVSVLHDTSKNYEKKDSKKDSKDNNINEKKDDENNNNFKKIEIIKV